ncbi:MAG: NUDIX domain-containing protein [Candidatus Berkelbacteria bacterium]|nr:NUDIX domain-containing protein [Candidatus Berkelbacteria bacterium]
MPITPIDENLIYVYIVVGSVIEKDGKFLLVQEKKPEVRGLWNLPAGKAEKNLTLEENAIKEAKEETGFDVEIVKEIDIYHKKEDKSLKHAFKARIIGGELKIPKDEILDARWFSFEEIEDLNKQNKIRNDWIFKAIQSQISKK